MTRQRLPGYRTPQRRAQGRQYRSPSKTPKSSYPGQPQVRTLDKLARALGVEAKDLFA
jgi:hypothetical protein